MELKKSIMNVVNNVPCLYNLQVYCFYKRQFRRYLRLHHIPNVPAEGEAEYLLMWGGSIRLSLIPTGCFRGLPTGSISCRRISAGVS